MSRQHCQLGMAQLDMDMEGQDGVGRKNVTMSVRKVEGRRAYVDVGFRVQNETGWSTTWVTLGAALQRDAAACAVYLYEAEEQTRTSISQLATRLQRHRLESEMEKITKAEHRRLAAVEEQGLRQAAVAAKRRRDHTGARAFLLEAKDARSRC